MIDHPSREILEEFAHDVLNDRAAVETHLRSCEACTAVVEEYHDEEETLRELLAEGSVPQSVPRRRWEVVMPIAASILFLGTLFAVMLPRAPEGVPIRSRDQDPVRDLVQRWLESRLEGKDRFEREMLEGAIKDFGRKALPVLREHESDAGVSALIEKIQSKPLRVLYVDGQPRMEYRYLKNALIRDPNLLVHVLLTSADPGFPQEHSQKAEDPRFQESITEFPKLEELLEYDVVLLGDIPPDRIKADELRIFVAQYGGGVALLAGDDHNPRSYRGTPLESLVPVVMGEAAGSGERFECVVSNSAFRSTAASVIAMFAVHPPPGVRAFITAKPKEGSDVLVEVVPPEGVKMDTALFVSRTVGRGRVFWCGTDDTWLWRERTGDEPYFYPFHRGVIDWLGRQERAQDRLTLFLDPERKVKMEFVRIPAGGWAVKDHESGQEKRWSTDSFWMQTTEVTQAQWEAVMGANPASTNGADLPVDRVSVADAWTFLRKLCDEGVFAVSVDGSAKGIELKSSEKGRVILSPVHFLLPTPEEWEYACRAGSHRTKWHCGDDEAALDEYAWTLRNSERKVQPVAQKKPNDWGLYDMHGNVWELCDTRTHKQRCEVRGGSYDDKADDARCDAAEPLNSSRKEGQVGFRIVLNK